MNTANPISLPSLTLVSHPLCPYVQRVAIVLREKGLTFDRIDIDLANKPDWFLKLSPLGKTPVLRVGEQAIFESAVICEYLDDTYAPSLHPVDALERATHRAWMEFGSNLLQAIGAFYNAPDAPALASSAQTLHQRFAQIEQVLASRAHPGRYFSGDSVSMVDAVFAPVFRYFDVFDTIGDYGVFTGLPHVRAWRDELASRASVRQSVGTDYPGLLHQFLLARPFAAAAGLAQRASTRTGSFQSGRT